MVTKITPSPHDGTRYQHDESLKGFGFYLRIASLLFCKYAGGNSACMKQTSIIKSLNISRQCFQSHLNYRAKDQAKRMKKIGLRRYRVGSCYYWELDTAVYQRFIGAYERKHHW